MLLHSVIIQGSSVICHPITLLLQIHNLLLITKIKSIYRPNALYSNYENDAKRRKRLRGLKRTRVHCRKTFKGTAVRVAQSSVNTILINRTQSDYPEVQGK